MRDTEFELNRALSLPQLGTIKGITTVSTWLRERNDTLSSDEEEWLKQESFQGRGGAAYFNLRNQRDDSSLRVQLDKLAVQENSAIVGGNPDFKCVM